MRVSVNMSACLSVLPQEKFRLRFLCLRVYTLCETLRALIEIKIDWEWLLS